MSKKSFRTSFDDILGGNNTNTNTVQKDVSKNFEVTKSTFIIRCDQLDKIKAISYLERKMIKQVLEEALTLFIEKYEAENKPLILPNK